MAEGFDDGKDEGALRTIGEVGQALGIKAHVLRYWEQQFPMLQPLKRSGGRRYYRPEDVKLVETIDRLVNREGYTLKGAKAAIKAGKAGSEEQPMHKGAEEGQNASDPASAEVPVTSGTAPDQTSAAPDRVGSEILPRLKQIREELAAALAA